MLCSEIELGLGEDADGIMDIPPGEPGTPYQEMLGEQDTAFEIDVPSNRGDALSHVGIAREVAALTGRKLRLPKIDPKEKGKSATDSFEVTVENLEDCPRFTAHLIRGIQVGPSPDWLVRRLESVGQRSINNVVDVTNFVMLEMGQPLHSFDLERLGTGRIHVRRARPGELITTLDGVDRELTPEVLLITDGERPIAAGGIMGGANTEVHEGTSDILLEAACFNSQRVLWGSRALRLDTDASARFRRGVDPGGVARAAKRAAILIAEIAGGTLAPGMQEVLAPDLLAPQTVELRPEKVSELLGDPVSEDEIEERLKSFGFDVKRKRKGAWPVGVPSWRRDVLEECDLIEEIARHCGYDTIGVRQFNASGVAAGVQPDEMRRDRIRVVLGGFGFHEAVTRVLVDSTAAVRVGLDEQTAARSFFPVLDPPSREEEGLRVSLLPSLLAAVSHNLRHGQPEIRLYEIGKTFHRTDEGGEVPASLPQEATWIGLAATGGEFGKSLERAGRSFNLLEFKGIVEGLLSAFRIDAPKWCSYNGLDLVPRGSLEVLKQGEPLGFVWEVNSEIRSRWDLGRSVYLAQIRMDVLPLESEKPIRYAEPSRYPAVKRDLALIVPASTSQGEVRSWIEDEAGPHLDGL
jgi:phenylalanyl-tRNA synthetase beta chain